MAGFLLSAALPDRSGRSAALSFHRRSAIISLSDYMYRDLTKGSIAKGLIWFALAGPVGEVGIRIAIPTGWFFTDTISVAERRFCREIEGKGAFL
ncbi:hypothetical protein [Agathobaculum butyriciproducens]|uniref:hypothetical protein n=1 Tax=Agathobaculum butyriciproducens TaxID=1628085 RepID=UPI0036D3480F